MTTQARRHNHCGQPPYAPMLLAIVVAMIGAGCPAVTLAAPQGATVVHGSAAIAQEASQTTIHASHNAIINYSSFNVAPHESVRFVQPHTSARVLNRITNARPTVIEGQLNANGVLYFVNPAGLYFAGTARINVSGIHAAAGHLSDANFLGGIDRFTDLHGQVTNHGLIRGGNVSLIGNQVANSGQIHTDSGILTMVAGDQVYLTQHGGRITVEVDPTNVSDATRPSTAQAPGSEPVQPGVDNSGTLSAPRGQVLLGAGDMVSLAIRNRGSITAAGGQISVVAKTGAITNEGHISASVDHGQAGTVTVQGPAVVHSGQMTADARDGAAGQIRLNGDLQTDLRSGSRISASGGLGVADGGDVVVNSDNGTTTFARGATIDAHAGAAGGRGGHVEVSGEQVRIAGQFDLHGANGRSAGSLLIDPSADIHIVTTAMNDGDVEASSLVGAASPVTVMATQDLFVDVDLGFQSQDVDLEAGRDVWLNASVSGVDHFEATAGGMIVLNFAGGPVVSSRSLKTYHSPVLLRQDAQFNVTTAEFWGTIDSETSSMGQSLGRSLTVNGSADLHGAVGGQPGSDSMLGNLIVEGATGFFGATVTTINQQTYKGAVTLNGHTTLQGATVEFHHLVTNNPMTGPPGQEADLRIEGDAVFGYPVSIGTPAAVPPTPRSGLARLVGSVTVTGRTQIGWHGLDTNTITTARNQHYQGPVTLAKNGVLTSLNGDITFDSTIDGQANVPSDLRVVAELGNVTFGGHIGLSAPLDELTAVSGVALVPGKVIAIGGDRTNPTQIVATGNVEFNPSDSGPLPSVPDIATIAAPDGDVNITSLDGNFIMGRNQKFTTIGNLQIDVAGQGKAAQIGDLNAFGDITINAGDIVLLLRSGAALLQPAGSRALDSAGSLDFVASGRFFFNGAVTTGGAGGSPIFGSPLATSSATGGPGGFRIVQNVALTRADYTFGSTVLDLTPRVPPADDPANAIPTGPLPFEDRMVREPLLGPEAQNLIQKMAVGTRTARLNEYQGWATLTRYYSDLSQDLVPLPANSVQPVALDRIHRANALDALGQFQAIFLEQAVDPVTQETVVADQTAKIKEVLSGAWEAYTSQADSQPSAQAFRTYLLDEPAWAQAREYAQRLNTLLKAMHLIGVNDAEFTAAVHAVLGPVTPKGMTPDDLYTAVTGQDRPSAPGPVVMAQ